MSWSKKISNIPQPEHLVDDKRSEEISCGCYWVKEVWVEVLEFEEHVALLWQMPEVLFIRKDTIDPFLKLPLKFLGEARGISREGQWE